MLRTVSGFILYFSLLRRKGLQLYIYALLTLTCVWGYSNIILFYHLHNMHLCFALYNEQRPKLGKTGQLDVRRPGPAAARASYVRG